MYLRYSRIVVLKFEQEPQRQRGGKAGSVVNVMKSKGRLDEKKRRLWVKAEKKVVWGREVELTLTRHNW